MPGVKRKLQSAVEVKTKVDKEKASKDAVERNRVAIEKCCPPGFEKLVTIDQVIEFSQLNHDQFVLCTLWFCQMVLNGSGLSKFEDMVEYLWLIDDLYDFMFGDSFDCKPKKVCRVIKGGQITISELFETRLVRALIEDKQETHKETKEFFSIISYVKFCQFKAAMEVLYKKIQTPPVVRDLGAVHMLKILKLIPKRIRHLELNEVTILDLVPVLMTLLRIDCLSWDGCGIGGDSSVYNHFSERVLDPFIEAFTLLENYMC